MFNRTKLQLDRLFATNMIFSKCYDFNSHYILETEMQYMHDNLNMHTICGGTMQYACYDPNPLLRGTNL
jgi:hypothetical protein